MGKYLLRRILQMIPVVLGTTLLVYALVFALPGDPVKAMFGDKPVNHAVEMQIRAEYNLDKPFIGQYFLGVKWRILPVTAGTDPGFFDLLMPAMVLGSVSMAYIIRLSRSEISSNISEDYVRTARAKGMSNKSVMLRHVLRNSMIPVVTYLGQDLGALMGGAMITEQIFNIHGVGFLTYQSILKGEANVVVSVVTLLTLIFVVCNLLVDLLYAALDPRIRYA